MLRVKCNELLHKVVADLNSIYQALSIEYSKAIRILMLKQR